MVEYPAFTLLLSTPVLYPMACCGVRRQNDDQIESGQTFRLIVDITIDPSLKRKLLRGRRDYSVAILQPSHLAAVLPHLKVLSREDYLVAVVLLDLGAVPHLAGN
jgi:hypothetical protein